MEIEHLNQAELQMSIIRCYFTCRIFIQESFTRVAAEASDRGKLWRPAVAVKMVYPHCTAFCVCHPFWPDLELALYQIYQLCCFYTSWKISDIWQCSDLWAFLSCPCATSPLFIHIYILIYIKSLPQCCRAENTRHRTSIPLLSPPTSPFFNRMSSCCL